MARERKIDMVILGLLNHEDLTGYDIKKRIDGAIGFFWKGSFGNIYPALKNMESGGMITKSDTSMGGREKTSYHITQSGRKALKDWLKEEQVSNELKYETILKLFFGGAESRDTSIRNIEVFEEQIQKDLKLLKTYSEALKKASGEEDHIYYLLSVSFGIATYEAYLKWCVKAKKQLKQRGGK